MPSTDRVALVTGAARGIGAATVATLAASRWRVVAGERCAPRAPPAAAPAPRRARAPRGGRSRAVASAAATRGLPMLAAYCAAKAGVTGFIRALAVELGGTGVTANAVSPGSTATPILDQSARLYDLPD